MQVSACKYNASKCLRNFFEKKFLDFDLNGTDKPIFTPGVDPCNSGNLMIAVHQW